MWINGLVLAGPRQDPNCPSSVTFGTGLTWIGGSGTGCRGTNNAVFEQIATGICEAGHGGTGILMEGNISFANGLLSDNSQIACPAAGSALHGNIAFCWRGVGAADGSWRV